MDRNTPEQQTEQLVQMYAEAHFYLLALLQSLEEGSTKKRKKQLLKQVQSIMFELSESAADASRDIIQSSYTKGLQEAVKQLKLQGIDAEELIKPQLKTVIHKNAVQAIIDENFYRILECNDNMAQDVKKRIEEITQRANRRSLIEGISRKQATKDAVAEVLDKGITGIITKSGAEIPADKYMANVVQYHQRKAHVDGVVNGLIENKRDLVYVNSVGITCELCAKYQGRVYSISGEDGRFPKLDMRPPYHSHCVHSVSSWVEDYQNDLDVKKALKDSNRPFADNRTENNIKKYEEIQRDKSKKNDARKQWIRYKARMPDLPDLRTFASQKARNTKLYQQWMEEYRLIGSEIKKRGG